MKQFSDTIDTLGLSKSAAEAGFSTEQSEFLANYLKKREEKHLVTRSFLEQQLENQSNFIITKLTNQMYALHTASLAIFLGIVVALVKF